MLHRRRTEAHLRPCTWLRKSAFRNAMDRGLSSGSLGRMPPRATSAAVGEELVAFEGADAPPGAVGSRDGRDKHACAAEAVLADGAADGDEEAASAVHWSRSQLPRPGPPPAHALWTASVRSAVAVAPLLLVTLREQASNAEGSPKLECDAGTARLA